jgi:hypothetical protein
MRSRMKGALGLILLAGLAGLGACDWFEDQRPEEVTVLVTGDAGVTVEVITSKKLVAARTETGETRVQLLEADTAMVTIPWSETYNIAGDYRFFLQVANPDSPDPVVNAEVLLDGESRYDQGGILREVPFRFLYLFNQRMGAVVEVL